MNSRPAEILGGAGLAYMQNVSTHWRACRRHNFLGTSFPLRFQRLLVKPGPSLKTWDDQWSPSYSTRHTEHGLGALHVGPRRVGRASGGALEGVSGSRSAVKMNEGFHDGRALSSRSYPPVSSCVGATAILHRHQHGPARFSVLVLCVSFLTRTRWPRREDSQGNWPCLLLPACGPAHRPCRRRDLSRPGPFSPRRLQLLRPSLSLSFGGARAFSASWNRAQTIWKA